MMRMVARSLARADRYPIGFRGNMATSDDTSPPSPLDLVLRRSEKCAIDHVTNWLPDPAVKLHKPHLLDRPKVVWSGTYSNSRERDRALKVLQRSGLSHDVLAREVIATLFEHSRQGFGSSVTKENVAISL